MPKDEKKRSSRSTGNGNRLELQADELRRRCAPASLSFDSTVQVDPTDRLIGQGRAVEALEFGLGVEVEGYNVFVVGPTGTGKTTYTRELLGREAEGRPAPPDWCYVQNLSRPEEPLAITLPPGSGPDFKQDMESLVRLLRVKIPEAFGSDEYLKEQADLRREFADQSQQVMNQIEQTARARGFAVRGTPSGLATVPIGRDGQPLPENVLQGLPEDQQLAMAERMRQLQEEITGLLRGMAKLEHAYQERREALDRKIVIYAIDPLFHRLSETYAGSETVVEHLKNVRKDIILNYEEFRQNPDAAGGPGGTGGPGSGPAGGPPGGSGLPPALRAALSGGGGGNDPYVRYRVNVFVSQKGGGAPVVYEPNPTYFNLGGKIDYRGELGRLATDFTMLSPGALHRANGGYLILNAQDVLTSPGAWDLLKRSLLTGEIRIENPAERSGTAPTAGMQPEPIPLRLKVVMLGPIEVYQTLYQADPSFRKLFKIKAEFDPEMPRNPKTEGDYAAFIAGVCRKRDLKPFDRSAVARVVEYGSRLADSQDKLSLRFNELAEIVYEAEAWSRRARPDLCPKEPGAGDQQADGEKTSEVTAADVERAIEEKEYRSRLVAEKMEEMIDRGEFLIDLGGSKVGQINGLAVLDTGDFAFGKPSRITAETYMGTEGVINIERQAALSGNIHSKGVLILQGYLAGRFAQDKPLSLSATLCFEQSYGGVDGDSASLAETLALLSSLADVPLQQAIAVTGSVNQKGEVQPVGGLDHKIEGFFEACRAQGLSGSQGVVMPRRSVGRLMLRDDVVEAVREGRFHVWGVQTVDQALEILTGQTAGERGPDGTFPEGTVYRRVEDKLRGFVERLAELRGYQA